MTNASNSRARRWTVAVLAGGMSAERDVSLRSGGAVATALRAGGHRVIEIDPAEKEIASISWDAVDCLPEMSDGHFSTAAVTSHPSPVTKVDVVLIALHGAFGEDGDVQEILSHQGIPFTGSGPMASRLAFSKSLAKHRFSLFDVPTPTYQLLHFTDDEVQIHAAADQIGYPLVVKPDRQGSSLGVTIVTEPRQLLRAAAECFRFDSVGLIESAILGEEWTVGILDETPFPPIRIETPRAFYDFAAKYDDDGTRYQIEDNDPELRDRLITTARSACRALGTRGIVRVDLRVDQEKRPWVLEVNTIPGMTDHSLVPKAARSAGMSMTTLCEKAIELALESHRRHQNAHAARDRHRSGQRRQAG